MQSWKQISLVYTLLIVGVVPSTAQDGADEGHGPVLNNDETQREDSPTSSSPQDLPTQPTLRQVLESMKPPSLTEEAFEPESTLHPGGVPASDLHRPVTRPTLTSEEVANTTHPDNSTSTSNSTATSKLCHCVPLNRTEEQWTVRLVNASGLYSALQTDGAVRARSQPGRCLLVLFYGVCCPFSAAAAPHFNAVARAFPELECLAVEATAAENDMSLNSRFGVIAVPTVLLFHHGRPMARFNESEISLRRLADMVQAQTTLTPSGALNVTAADFEGPLPATARQTFNWYLALAWAFIAACAAHASTRLQLWRRAADNVRNWWIEAQQHLHEE